MMKVKNHRLYHDNDLQVDYVPSPNRSQQIDPKYLIMHYTAGSSFRSSLNWLTNPISKASAHLLIGRDGEIAQMVPFNIKAWHAGQSSWNNLEGMNSYAIGIELDNAGKMVPYGNNRWRSWFGKVYDDDEVLEATHKHEDDPAGWQVFTEKQLEVAVEVATILVNHYGLQEVIGHDDVSPFRKVDPGPAFPMQSFSSKVMGRRDDEVPVFVTTTALNIRVGPGTEYEQVLEISPLPKNTRVIVINSFLNWKYVDVIDPIHATHDGRGWVHSRYLREVE